MRRLIFTSIFLSNAFQVSASLPDLRYFQLHPKILEKPFIFHFIDSERSLDEAYRLLKDLFSYFPEFKSVRISDLKEIILENIALVDSTNTSKDLERYFNSLSIFSFHGSTELGSLDPSVLEDELPGSIIIGIIELGCGALLWLTPFKSVGSGLLVAGARRIFNELEAKDKAIRSNS